MAKLDNLSQLLNQGNTVLHVAPSLDPMALVKYITEGTKIEGTSKDVEDLLRLSTVLMLKGILVERPTSPREMADDDLKKQKEILKVQTRDTKENFKMQLEGLQSARNTLVIVAVLIASVTFTCGINPPGGVYQEGHSIGKTTAGKTLAFMIFSISNSVALFTSVSMVILLVSVIPYREDSLLKFLVIAHWMMWVAVAAMASAYVSAAWVTLPHFRENKWLLYATFAIAGLTLGSMFVYLRFKLVKCLLRKVQFLKTLSNQALVHKNGSVDMAANIIEGYYSYC